MSAQYSLQSATTNDASVLAEIYNGYIAGGDTTMDTRPTTAADWMRTLVQQGAREVTVTASTSYRADAREIVGFGVLKKYSDRPGYLYCAETSVYLRGAVHRLGVGTGMKQELIRLARVAGYRYLVAKLFATNTGAIRYNEALGYRVVGTQHSIGYTSGRWQDITILELTI